MPELEPGESRAATFEHLRRLAPALALAAVVIFVLPGVFLGRALYLRDVNMVWLPQVESFVRSAGTGGGILWDPYSGLGRPLLADPRAEILYPPTWLNLLIGPATYYALFTVAHLVLAAAGMWRLARRDGLGPAAAATAAGLWIASGPLLSLVSMWHHLAAAAWIPWTVSACDALAERPSRRGVVTAAAAATAQVVAGSPDISVLTLPIVLVRVAERLARDDARAQRVARLGALVAAGALALALSAAQWIPTLDVVRRATRFSGGDIGAGLSSLHPEALGELLAPLRWRDMPLTASAVMAILEHREPWMRSIYLGAAAAVLVAAGLAAGWRRRASSCVLLVLGVALALGSYGPVYPLAARLPGVGALRYPVKALVVAAFAWSLLAGAGLQTIADGSRRARGAAIATSCAVTALLLAAWWIVPAITPGTGILGSLFAAPPPPEVGRPLLIAAAATIAAAAIVGGHGRASVRTVSVALALVVVGEAAWRHRDLNPTAPRALFTYKPEVLRALDRRDGARTYVYDYSIDPNVGERPRSWPYRVARQPADWAGPAALVLGIHAYLNPPTAARWGVFGSYDFDILGFDSVPVDYLTRSLRALEGTPGHLRLLQVGAVAQVLALEPAPWWADLRPKAEVPGFFQDPIRVFQVPDPLPRAYVVDGVRTADGEAAVHTMADPGFDPRREVVLPGGAVRPPGPDAAGSATIRRLEADRVDVDVDMRREGYLVLVDAFDPGWRADVDGRPAPVERANVAFRAVPVPAGRHQVTLRYRPRAIGVGLALSVIGLVVAAVLIRRPRAGQEPC